MSAFREERPNVGMVATKRQSEFEIEMKLLENEIACLEDEINRLGERLVLVRRSEPPNLTEKAKEAASAVPLTNCLRDLRRKLNGCREYLQTIYDQLEI